MPQHAETAEVEVHAVAYGGEGVARLPDGMTVFVPFAAVGDRLRVRVLSRGRRMARGAIQAVLRPGPARIEPCCPHYGVCGGCCYQHLAADEQLRLKAGQLGELLRRLGGLGDLPRVEAVASPLAYGYRNKATLRPVTRRGRLAGWGYTALDNETITPVSACPILHDDLNRELARVSDPAAAGLLPAQDKDTPLTLRRSAVGEVLAFRDPPAQTLAERALGRELRVPAGGFFQVNPAVLDTMLAWLRVDLSAHRPDALLDAYCGCGVFAVCLADLASRAVAGIETDAEAVRCAEVNARCAGVAASFQAGDVASLLDGALESLGPLEGTLVILDPPRRGCAEPVIAALRRRAPGRVIYLSCHPATLARDLSRLIIGGAYSVARLALFDMFPQTAHFEAAVALDRAGVGLAAERA